MIVLLLALVIVAYLSKDALRKYGLMPSGGTTVVKGATPGERTGSAAAGATERMDRDGSRAGPHQRHRQGARARRHAQQGGAGAGRGAVAAAGPARSAAGDA